MNASPQRRNCGAFTLLELIAVATIIGIVAALLAGVIRGGRYQREGAMCMNNLRALAQANLRYASEHDGQYCFAIEKTNRLRWHGERVTIEAPFDPRKGPLAPYLEREGRIKVCPTFDHALKDAASFEDGSGGYGYNAVYIGGSPENKWAGERVSNIERPASTVMFADTAMARKKGIQEYPFAEPWQWVTSTGRLAGPLSPSVHFRHNGFAHVAWCDGHVSAEKPSSVEGVSYYGGDNAFHKIGWFGPREQNGFWNPRHEDAKSGSVPAPTETASRTADGLPPPAAIDPFDRKELPSTTSPTTSEKVKDKDDPVPQNSEKIRAPR